MPRATPVLFATAAAFLAAAGSSWVVNGAKPAKRAITNAEGSCLVLEREKDKVIENLKIGPCAGNGIELRDSENITIRDVVITDTVGSGIAIFGSKSVEITENRITNTISGIYAVSASGIRVGCNTLEDPRGPIPRGQFVQFDKVVGGENRISCNVGRNRPGHGTPEDAISLYQSHGTAASPISVVYNVITGGGPSESGGGIMMGDDGGSHQLAKGNILVDPGQHGIAVSSGSQMSIIDNVVFGRQQPFTNVGIYTWNQYPHECHTIAVSGNKVKWTEKSGRPNPFWDGENCGKIIGINKNDFAARITPEVAETPSPECSCRGEGRR
jgi:hypothetical protein